jgi:Uma2 family endonuclease
MNAPAVPKARLKVPEFLAWADRQPDAMHYELVDGKVVAMAGDTVRHNLVKGAVYRSLQDAVRAAALSCNVFIDGVGITINENTLRIPDASVQCGVDPDFDAMIIEAPLIVVEVVSPSSERDDSGAKLVDYFSVPSIHHYLIVYPEMAVVVQHRRNEGGIDTRIAHAGDITLDPPGMTVSVAGLLGPASVGS